MPVNTREIVTTIAYMIGVKMESLKNNYSECETLIDKLCNDQDASVIRYLCRLRTTLMQKFKVTDDAIKYQLKNLNSLEWYDQDNIKQLEKWGFSIILANSSSQDYMQYFTKLINDNIDNCQHLFYDWLNWNYIKDLFYIPRYAANGVMKAEFHKYMRSIEDYPFKMYVHWTPIDIGNIIFSDGKFLKVIYEQHGDKFTDYTKSHDADDETRTNIYRFVGESASTAIAVDCENSDPFKLYSVLKGLDPEQLDKIEKITLYDDSHTTSGWDLLYKFIKIPVDHIEVERVVDNKSLVDQRMSTGVTTDYYRQGISSFIIVSSDSDFWGLISGLPDARFLVMYEYSKCGDALKSALENHGIYYCSIDDFCTAGTEELKRSVLFEELEKYLPSICGENPLELTKKLYETTKIRASPKEQELFCNRYVKTLQLKIVDGRFTIEIQK